MKFLHDHILYNSAPTQYHRTVDDLIDIIDIMGGYQHGFLVIQQTQQHLDGILL